MSYSAKVLQKLIIPYLSKDLMIKTQVNSKKSFFTKVIVKKSSGSQKEIIVVYR